MAKFIAIALIVSAAICSASPARLEKLIQSKSKFFARQAVAEDIPAQTPYPPSGIRPEVPFNLPTEEKVEVPTADVSTQEKIVAPADYYLPPVFEPAKFSVPAEVYGPPAETYGPPEVSPKVEDEEAQPEEAQPEEAQPEDAQPEDAQPEDAQPEEDQLEEAQPEEYHPEDTESEQGVLEVEPVETIETINNELERIVSGKNTKALKLKSAKLQKVQPVTAQRFFLIDGKLYTRKA